MAWDYPEPRKEEDRKSGQAGKDAHIHINLVDKYTYSDVEGFEMFSLGVNETINKPDTIEANITGIDRRIFGGNDKHSFLNKCNNTQVSGETVSP